MRWDWLDQRPIIIAIAGPNGAGKTTFFHSHIAPAGLRFINADQLAAECGLDAYTAAAVATAIRSELVAAEESFVFETVFSDPVGEKLAFLGSAAEKGYTVILCFIAIESASISDERVAMRVTQGGHDVPSEKLKSRFPRTMRNLQSAIAQLPHVIVFDNSNLSEPFKLLAVFENGSNRMQQELPTWLKSQLGRKR